MVVKAVKPAQAASPPVLPWPVRHTAAACKRVFYGEYTVYVMENEIFLKL